MSVTRVRFERPSVGDAVTVIAQRINGWRHRVRKRQFVVTTIWGGRCDIAPLKLKGERPWQMLNVPLRALRRVASEDTQQLAHETLHDIVAGRVVRQRRVDMIGGWSKNRGKHG